MPFEIVSAPGDVIEVTASGELTAADVEGISDGLLALAHAWCRVLYDAVEVENASAALALYLRSPWYRDMPDRVRQALVIGPGAAAVARTWLRMSRERSAGVQAFPSREQALPWLLAEYQTTTRGS